MAIGVNRSCLESLNVMTHFKTFMTKFDYEECSCKIEERQKVDVRIGKGILPIDFDEKEKYVWEMISKDLFEKDNENSLTAKNYCIPKVRKIVENMGGVVGGPETVIWNDEKSTHHFYPIWAEVPARRGDFPSIEKMAPRLELYILENSTSVNINAPTICEKSPCW